MNTEFEIRKAVESDAESLYDIVYYWYEQSKHFDNELGYLKSEIEYSLTDIKKIITESYTTVAICDEKKVVSFYLINHFLDIGDIEERKVILNKLIENNTLPKGRYGYCLLSSTHKDYTNRGLNRETLNLLRENAKKEYDYFIGVMSYDNFATQKSSLKMGWKHFGDIGIGLLAVIGTTEERNNLLKP